MCTVKRHDTRFFADKTDAKLDGNPRSGVAFFEDVTIGHEKDFYLVSADTLKGTARPTHYVVLENNVQIADDNKKRTPTIKEIADMVSGMVGQILLELTRCRSTSCALSIARLPKLLVWSHPASLLTRPVIVLDASSKAYIKAMGLLRPHDQIFKSTTVSKILCTTSKLDHLQQRHTLRPDILPVMTFTIFICFNINNSSIVRSENYAKQF